jgi:hypothetical protein
LVPIVVVGRVATPPTAVVVVYSKVIPPNNSLVNSLLAVNVTLEIDVSSHMISVAA